MLINFLVASAAFVVCVVLTSLLKNLSLRRGVLIRQGIPLTGGIAIGLSLFLVCLVSFFLYGGLPKDILAVLAAAFIMLVFGIIDDKFELGISAKFLVQLIAASLLVFSGVRTHIVNIGIAPNLIITFIWVMGIANAFNHLDVMDGLAASVASAVSLGLLFVCLIPMDIKTAIVLCALIGTLFGFLIYNLPPARVYLGNSGSHFLGFFLAGLALAISYAPMERRVALFSPLIILGFPMFDTAFVILMRLKNRSLPFKKSNDHPALRLLKNGYSKPHALTWMIILCVFFVVSGAALSVSSNSLGAIIITLVILVSLWLTIRIGRIRA